MASRMEHADKILPKTGVNDVDSLAILVHSCMQRMGAALLKSDTHASQPKHRFLPSADGMTAVDVTVRTNMGKVHEGDDSDGRSSLGQRGRYDDDRSSVLDSSDVRVAESSLIRLLHAAADGLFSLDTARAENARLRSEADRNAARINELEDALRAATTKVEQLEDPTHAFSTYHEAWSRQFGQGQVALVALEQEKHEILREYVEKRRAVQGSAMNVSKRRVLFRETARLLEEEFRPDEPTLDKLMAMFRPQGKASLGSRPTSADVSVAAPTAVQAGSQAGSGGGGTHFNRAAPQVKSPTNGMPPIADKAEVEKEKLLSAISAPVEAFDESTVDTTEVFNFVQTNVKGVELGQARGYRLDAAFDADKQEFTAESIRRASLSKLKRQKQAQLANSADLVISKHISSGVRRIQTSEATQSLISHLFNVLVYAPATYVELEIDMSTTIGRSDAIAEQAHRLNLQLIWDAAAVMEKPSVRIAKLAGPTTDEELLIPYNRSLDVTTVPIRKDEYGILPESEQVIQRSMLHKILCFRRADDDEYAARNYMLPMIPDEDVHFLRMKQAPGILDYIGRGFGARPGWISPFATHAVRVYASSCIDSCSAEALIQKFQDHHSPFFMTRDEPRQFVSLSFSSVLFIPTGYSVASTHPIVGGLYPRHWRVEGSIDGNKWILLRRHDDDRTLDRHSPTAYWDIPRPKRGSPFFQHFRLVQEGVNAQGTQNFCVSCIEIYGRVIYVAPKTVPASPNVADIVIKKRGFTPLSALPAFNKAVVGVQPKKK